MLGAGIPKRDVFELLGTSSLVGETVAKRNKQPLTPAPASHGSVWMGYFFLPFQTRTSEWGLLPL